MAAELIIGLIAPSSDENSAMALRLRHRGWRIARCGSGFLLAIVASAAHAEVCDKFDERWRTGDPPVVYYPAGALHALQSSSTLLCIAMTVGIAAPVATGQCRILAFLAAGAWTLYAAFVLLVDAFEMPYRDRVYRAAIEEGCAAFSAGSPFMIPLLCVAMAGALTILATARAR